jgi:glycosyltransferase involved in cell wall biosynthesis/predicted nucleic acid-binding protein
VLAENFMENSLMQIIVLGMHRSGTSAVARLLNMMGAYFAPERVELPINPANPKGYWERRDVVNLNEDIFKSLDISWDKIAKFTSKSINSEIVQRFQPYAAEIILGLDAQRPWMLKDPRLCLLLPLWLPLLEVPVCVFVYRSPIQVAQSLAKRDKLSLRLGMALWEKYNLCALEDSRQLQRILINYEDLMQHPVATVKKLYEQLQQLEVQGLRLPSEKEICTFLEPTLFHAQGDDSLQNAYVTPQQANLFNALQDGSILTMKPLPSLSGGAQEILEEYEQRVQDEAKITALQQEISQLRVAHQGEISQLHVIHQARETTLAEEMARVKQDFDKKWLANLRSQALIVSDYQGQLIAAKQQGVQQAEEFKQQFNIAQEHHAQLEQQLFELRIERQHLHSDLIALRNTITGNKQELAMRAQKLATLEVIEPQLAEKTRQLAEKEQQLSSHAQELASKNQHISALTQRVHKQEENVQRLWGWVMALQTDIFAVFNSLSWKSGRSLTNTIMRLTLRSPGATAEDHIRTLLANIAHHRAARPDDLPSSEVAVSPNISTTASSTPPTPTPDAPRATLHHSPIDYQRWIKNYDTLNSKIIKRMQQQIAEWGHKPVISIVMPTYNTEEKWLRAAIESVIAQIYPNWELCIADDASTQPQVRQVLQEYANRDQRIKVVFRDKNGHISAASNTALEIATGDFVGFLDHDDTLAEHALFWVVRDINQYPNHKLWYSDEDKINENNDRYDPYFKSDWNYDLFLSHNLVTHFAVYRTDLIRKIGGLREGYEGAQDYDLVLRVIEQISPVEIRHIPRVLYHWRAIATSTAVSPDAKPYALLAAQKAIAEHLDRKGMKAEVMDAPEIRGANRVQYQLPNTPPLVSILIPTRNAVELVRMCVESILDKTDYKNYEILIINNNSDDPVTLNYMEKLEMDGKARVVDYPYPFNYAAMNNYAVEHAHGEVIVLLNNDIEVINGGWLTEMVSLALRPDIGAVGARLWYPDNTLQHGGVVLGIGGVAGHAHKAFPRGNVGYFGRAALLQNFSAVTGACLATRKSVYLTVGGLDAEHLTVALNDVDFCLKMSELGLRVVWTPYAELYHHESATRGYEDTPEKSARYEKERLYMKNRWENFLLMDPAYSPNLTLETQDFVYSWPPRISLTP